MLRHIVIVWLAFVSLAAPLCAHPVDDCKSLAGLSCTQMKLAICPAGDFEYFRKACGGTSDYLWVEARDTENQPVPGIPQSDFWAGSCDPAQRLFLCAEPIVADSMTGSNGRTTFSGRIKGGGCVLSGGMYVAIQGFVIKKPPRRRGDPCIDPLCVNVIVKGPDLTGTSGPDGIVDLRDFAKFCLSFHKSLGSAEYNPCCDFNDDDTCNLSDFAFFGEHYQHQCQ